MKKIISLMLVMLIAVFACGCGADNSTPDGAVEAYIEAMKELDMETVYELQGMDEDDIKDAMEEYEEAKEEQGGMMEATEILLGKLEYEIDDIDEDDDEATVKVKINKLERPDDYEPDFDAEDLQDMDEDELAEAMADAYVEAAEAFEVSDDTVTVKIKLEKDDDVWVVEESAAGKITGAMGVNF